MVHQGRARVTYLKSTCSGFWRLLLLSLSDSALVLAAAAAWRFNFSREALTSPCHRTKNIARCTRANIHPSRIPRLALSPLPSALAPPLSLVPLRVASHLSLLPLLRRHAPRPCVLREILDLPIIFAFRDWSSRGYRRHFIVSRASRGLLKKYVYQFPYLSLPAKRSLC